MLTKVRQEERAENANKLPNRQLHPKLKEHKNKPKK